MKALNWHLGLGDAIICAPIAVKYAKEFGGLRVPCYPHNRVNVESLFVNHPEIEVFEVKDHNLRLNPGDINLGFYSHVQPFQNEGFDSWFVRQAEMTWDEMDELCPIKEAVKKIRQATIGAPIHFVHEDVERGFKIDENLLPKVPRTEIYRLASSKVENFNYSMLAFAHIISTAPQVHVIDSSFLHLADRLDTVGELYWHVYARVSDMSKNLRFRKPWTKIQK